MRPDPTNAMRLKTLLTSLLLASPLAAAPAQDFDLDDVKRIVTELETVSPRNPNYVYPLQIRVAPSPSINAAAGYMWNESDPDTKYALLEVTQGLLDAPGQPFWDPDANRALFTTLEETVRHTANRQLVRVPHNINDPAFAELIVKTFRSFHAAPRRTAKGA